MIEEKNLHYDSALKIKQKYINQLSALTNTDYSEASSEVIYLEMMAYLSDLMNEYIDRIDQRHYYKYAKLLGLNRKPVVNQKRLAQFIGSGIVYSHEELLNNKSPFHLQQDMYLLPPLNNIYHDYGNGNEKINRFISMKDGCYPIQNDLFNLNIEFTEPLECEKIYSIYFDIQKVEGRNQKKSKDFHYGEWNLSYSTPFGISIIEIVEDQTYDFLFSGCIRFRLHEKMIDTVINLKFDAMFYDETPIINHILINTDVIDQMKIYAKTWQSLQNKECKEDYYLLQKIKDVCYQNIEIMDKKQMHFNEKDCLVVYQNKDIELFSYTLKGVVKEQIQLEKDVYIASIRIAVKINDYYQELEICDYWHDYPTKPYGCYLDREDNTLTFGNGRDYLLLPANTNLIFWEYIVFQKAPVPTTSMKTEHYELNVLQEISNFCEEEKLESSIMKISNMFELSYVLITEQDYITIAKSLPMSKFKSLKYLKGEHLLLYDCGVVMPKSFDRYFTNYMNQFSLINNEVRVKQMVYIDVDIVVKTKDVTLTKDSIIKELEPYLNQKQYDYIEKIKKQICININILDLIIYQDDSEIFYFQFAEDEQIRIKNLEIQLKI